MKWQTVYYRLRQAGHPVTGNKARWGGDKDKFGAKGEAAFKLLVPFALDGNEKKFQSKYDFDVLGVKVDVKSARPTKPAAKYPSMRWAFYMKKQIHVADFIVCLGFGLDGENVEKVFLIPTELAGAIDTLSIPFNGKSKWHEYEVDKDDLAEFFTNFSE